MLFKRRKTPVLTNFKDYKGGAFFCYYSQQLPDSQMYSQFSQFYRGIKEIDRIKICVKMHPDMDDWEIHKKLQKKYNISNVTNFVHDDTIPIISYLERFPCAINHYSTVGVEAVEFGNRLIQINFLCLPKDMFIEEIVNLVDYTEDYKEFVKYVRMHNLLIKMERGIKEIEYTVGLGDDGEIHEW